jgi:hypothetical protein
MMPFSFAEIATGNRSYQSNVGKFCNWPIGDCFFGVPTDELYGRKPLVSIPGDSRGFHFYLGADQQRLFDSFLNSDLPQSTTSLHVGNSCYRLGKGRDYSQLTASLLAREFPNLKALELGVWQLFSNSHCAYGNVGTIDGLGLKMPELRNLSIYGNFLLHHPFSIPQLEKLHITVDDPVTGMNGGPLDIDSVSNVLSSSFPNLRELSVDLGMEDETLCYSVPDSLANNNAFPQLAEFELVGTFRRGDKNRLLRSPLFQEATVKIYVDDMLELGEDNVAAP